MRNQRTMSMSMTGARQRGFVLMNFNRDGVAFMQNCFGQTVEAEPEVFVRRFEPEVRYTRPKLARATQEALVFDEDFEDSFGEMDIRPRPTVQNAWKHHGCRYITLSGRRTKRLMAEVRSCGKRGKKALRRHDMPSFTY